MTLIPLYVVILNLNLKDDTIACIETVLEAGVPLARIIVVDNGSSDGSAAALAARFGSDLTIICNSENLGFTGGNNVGISEAMARGAASVLLLNNDTVIAPNMIELLVEAGELPERPGILGPAIFYFDNPERLWKLGDIRYRWLPMPLNISQATMARRADLSPFEVSYVTGCAMLVRREVFEQVGLLDERYFAYFEEADFICRARQAGFRVWAVPQARVWHKISVTSKRDKPYFRYLRSRNQVRFYHEHPHGPLALLREAYILLKMVKTSASDIGQGNWRLLSPLWRGMVDGYLELWTQKPGKRAQTTKYNLRPGHTVDTDANIVIRGNE